MDPGGNVCNNGMDVETMGLICRELNCGRFKTERATKARVESAPNRLDDVKCRKHDSTLFHCPSSSWSQNNCDRSSEVTHITCSGEKKQLAFENLQKFFLFPNQGQCSNYMPIRLRGGEEICSGRLEVYHNAEWGSICADLWDIRDAQVVCRQLGCGPALSANRRAVDGSGGGTIWMNRVKCRGNEIHLWDCPHSLKIHTGCSHSAGVTCADIFVTLPFSSETTTTYTTVPAQLTEKKTVPPSKNPSSNFPYIYPVSLLVLGSVLFLALVLLVVLFYQNRVLRRVISKARRKTLLEAVYEEINHKCVTNRYTKRENYGEVYDDIIPAEESPHITTDSVRLVDGGSRCAGRVEVLHRGHWGTVCDDYWDMRDAAVVCRELGCGEAIDAPRRARFGSGSGPIWVEYANCAGSESSLKNCRLYDWGRQRCNHDEDAGAVCAEVRLVGRSRCSGRVEVLHGESWVTVCDADFDQQGAEVVCRELGCGSPVEVLGAAAFGRAEGQMWSEELQCRGNESHMYLCQTSPSLKPNCSHNKDVGLRCSGHTQARLMNGSDSCSGRVELQYLSEWGTVCDVSWDMRAASVLCAQLKCGSSVAVLGSDWFGEGSGRIWSDVFDCQGNETHLLKCPISSWSRTACSHEQDAGVICSGSSLASHEGGVRLSGGMECEGEVEVFFRQDWRRVLLDSWSESEASVVCRQLGCGSVLNTSSSSSSSPEHSYMCVTGFNCSGSEAHLRNCSSSQAVNCSSTVQLYITCSGYSSIRLVGSGGDCAGRLEVFHSGSWGTVSDELWDIEDAQVVCRQLQCGVALSAPVPVPARFGSGTGPIWLNEVECEGNEVSLWNCRYQLCGEDECGHKDDVGVVCSENGNTLDLTNWLCDSSPHERPCSKHIPLRLRGGVGSCSGWLQVYHNKTWGSVCGDLWDIRDAQVICRQLGCGPALSANRRAADGSGGGTIWMNRVKCRGNEIHLWDCPHSLKNHTDCSHSAGVTCGDSQPQTRRIILPQTPPPAVPSIYPVSLLVLGYVLFLALVLLVVLFYQNRVLRRVISKRRKTSAEPVYEEIDTRLIPKRITVSTETSFC
ncbi:deleted in malignant brain tumors 1 protein-like isoform X5 [Astyanax mexicanus]|uniref:deleted in malignant brain tumors 1 protein-like isoform X5 n=1 Tax=Astyanax mexicanus TaxID=7994 RepID=UPI0020CAA057|nr:deleted in malignant brain tumors 1 protein-like isoform X5 [Astyanax mexicanus]